MGVNVRRLAPPPTCLISATFHLIQSQTRRIRVSQVSQVARTPSYAVVQNEAEWDTFREETLSQAAFGPFPPARAGTPYATWLLLTDELITAPSRRSSPCNSMSKPTCSTVERTVSSLEPTDSPPAPSAVPPLRGHGRGPVGRRRARAHSALVRARSSGEFGRADATRSRAARAGSSRRAEPPSPLRAHLGVRRRRELGRGAVSDEGAGQARLTLKYTAHLHTGEPSGRARSASGGSWVVAL